MKKFYFTLLTLLLVSSAFAGAPKRSFNSGWAFAIEGQSSSEVNLPHHYNSDAYQTAKYYRGEAKYSKRFMVGDDKSHLNHFLQFEGVNSEARVVLNGVELSHHKGGYTMFYVELTDHLKYSEYNTLEVYVDNRNENFAPLSGDFTIFGGIYRPVWWIEKGCVSLDFNPVGGSGFQFNLGDVSESRAESSVELSINNRQQRGLRATIEIECTAPDGTTTYIYNKKHKLSGGVNAIDIELPVIKNPMLWSPSEPNLYTLSMRIMDGKGEVLDRLTQRVGYRWVEISGDGELLLNGKAIKLLGASRHQDREGYGIALSDRQHYDDMAQLKDMGANFVRLAHYPQSKAVLDACDELGLMVWEEISVVDIVHDNKEFLDNAKFQLAEMVTQHYNHPSVIMWGYMNETIIQIPHRIKDTKEREKRYRVTVEMARELEAYCKELDPSRPTVMAYHGDWKYVEIGLSDVADISGWNLYNGWYGAGLEDFEAFVSKYHRENPTRPIIISEFGAGSDRRIHSLNAEKFDFSVEYQQEFMEHYWPVIMDSTYIMGGAMWNFIDFSSAARQESMPRINNKGLVYGDREPKDIFYYHKALLGDEPITYIAVRDWDNRRVLSVDSIHTIKVYSNEERVELFVDGKSKGVVETSNNIAEWRVPLTDGGYVLEAKAERSSDTAPLTIKYLPRQTIDTKRVDININAGSGAYYYPEASTAVYTPDMEYTKGSWGYIGGRELRIGDRPGTTSEIFLTEDDPIFQTQRKGNFTYRFDVPEGEYRVTLYIADLSFFGKSLAYDLGAGIDGDRSSSVMDVEINGMVVESQLSPADEVGGRTALIITYEIETSEPYIIVDFSAKSGDAILNAISVESL